MKAIGFNGGCFGDVIMGAIAARAHKLQYPDSILVCGVAEKYSAIAPTIKTCPYFDDVCIWKGYDGWPAPEDKRHVLEAGYDKVYNAMPQHVDDDWYLRRHQTEEMCLMHGLQPPVDLQIRLIKSFDTIRKHKTIAVSFFGETRGASKSLSVNKAKEIVDLLTKTGYNVVQLGLPTEPSVAQRYTGSFFDVIRFCLGCDALVTVDTAMAWVMSGYQFPVVGLYGHSYYPRAFTARNWQPFNPNAIYLESAVANDIHPERVLGAINNLLK